MWAVIVTEGGGGGGGVYAHTHNINKICWSDGLI